MNKVFVTVDQLLSNKSKHSFQANEDTNVEIEASWSLSEQGQLLDYFRRGTRI